jgi:hypothetical protein
LNEAIVHSSEVTPLQLAAEFVPPLNSTKWKCLAGVALTVSAPSLKGAVEKVQA